MSASPQLSKVSPAKVTTERRRHPRRAIVDDQIVAVTLDGDNGGLVLDLAEDGVAVQAVTPLQAGKPAELSFVLPDRKTSIRAHGEVRWAEESGRAGIRLVAFTQGSSADLRAALRPAPAASAAAEPPAKPPERPARGIDIVYLEREIGIRQLGREGAVAFLAERVCELAAASGVAIALGSRQEMICVASEGAAPSIGAKMSSDSGLSGECVRTGVLVRSDDTEDDPRVDAEVCRRLGLRSLVLLPVLDSGHLRGVLEVFSGRPRAFSDDDIRRFEQVAGLVAKLTREPLVEPPRNKLPAATSTAPVATVVAVPATIEAPEAKETSEAEERNRPAQASASLSPAVKYALAVGGALGVAVAGWGILHWRHSSSPPAPAPAVVAAAPMAAPVVTPPPPAPEAAAPARPTRPETMKPAKESKTAAAEKKSEAPKPPVTEEAPAMRELPTLPPVDTSEAAAPPVLTANTSAMPNLAAPRVEPLRPGQTVPGVVPGRLVHKIDPTYPETARRAHVGGSVVLSAMVHPDGKVGTVEVVSGNPLLARAAVDAVRQWRYEPFTLHGVPVEAEVTIHLNFHP